MDYGLLSSQHAMHHAHLCEANILYNLLYGNNHDILLSHVKGLIDAIDSPKPGQLSLLLRPLDWSVELTEAMELLRNMENHPLLSQPEHLPLRRTVYHAILLISLPHIATFTAYVLDRSQNREGSMRFVQDSVINSEEEFFYGNTAGFTDLESWVNHLRSRYACYV